MSAASYPPGERRVMHHYLSILANSHLYWFLSGLVLVPAAYFRGKLKGFQELRAIYSPVLDRVMESNADSIKLLCSVRDEMKRSGIIYYLSDEDQPPTKPTEH